MPDADIVLWRDLPLGAPSAEVLHSLIGDTAWRSDTIKLYGRSYAQPRLTAWHGDPGAAYRYSGLRLEPAPWTPLLASLRDRAAHHAQTAFNSVLVNWYRSERDSMGLHSDDEPELGPEPVIASLSLGAERRLLLRHKTRANLPPVRITLPDASLLVMRGATQNCWRHAIEKRRTPCAGRINLTFRRIMPTPR